MENFFERITKRLLPIALISAVVVFFIGSYDSFRYGLYQLSHDLPQEVWYISGAIAVFAGFVGYLQAGSKGKLTSKSDLERIQATLAQQHDQLSKLETAVDRTPLSDEQYETLTNRVLNSVSDNAIKTAFDVHAASIKQALESDEKTWQLRSASMILLERLKHEVAACRFRASVNLGIGMVITISGLLLLWNTASLLDGALAADQAKSLQQSTSSIDATVSFYKTYLIPLVPRVLLVVFIEVFAYFFLRLYKEGSNEAKFFQNELTNVEIQLIALHVAQSSSNSETLDSVVKTLSTTERNFVLSKGQSTVDLERSRMEHQDHQAAIKGISRFSLRKFN